MRRLCDLGPRLLLSSLGMAKFDERRSVIHHIDGATRCYWSQVGGRTTVPISEDRTLSLAAEACANTNGRSIARNCSQHHVVRTKPPNAKTKLQRYTDRILTSTMLLCLCVCCCVCVCAYCMWLQNAVPNFGKHWE